MKSLVDVSAFNSGFERPTTRTPGVAMLPRCGSVTVLVLVLVARRSSVKDGARKPSERLPRNNNDWTGTQVKPYFGTLLA